MSSPTFSLNLGEMPRAPVPTAGGGGEALTQVPKCLVLGRVPETWGLPDQNGVFTVSSSHLISARVKLE